MLDIPEKNIDGGQDQNQAFNEQQMEEGESPAARAGAIPDRPPWPTGIQRESENSTDNLSDWPKS